MTQGIEGVGLCKLEVIQEPNGEHVATIRAHPDFDDHEVREILLEAINGLYPPPTVN